MRFVSMCAMPSKYGSPTLVMIPPAKGAFSTSSVFAPERAAASAAALPAQPPPHTSTSVSMTRRSLALLLGSAAMIIGDAEAIAAVWMKVRRVVEFMEAKRL